MTGDVDFFSFFCIGNSRLFFNFNLWPGKKGSQGKRGQGKRGHGKRGQVLQSHINLSDSLSPLSLRQHIHPLMLRIDAAGRLQDQSSCHIKENRGQTTVFGTEDVYGKLFKDVGRNEGDVQRYFSARAERLGKSPALAFYSTTVSTYSENQSEARRGFNKDSNGLNTIKLLTLYSVKAR